MLVFLYSKVMVFLGLFVEGVFAVGFGDALHFGQLLIGGVALFDNGVLVKISHLFLKISTLSFRALHNIRLRQG